MIEYNPTLQPRRPWVARLSNGRYEITHFELKRESALAHVTRFVSAFVSASGLSGSAEPTAPEAPLAAPAQREMPGADTTSEADLA